MRSSDWFLRQLEHMATALGYQIFGAGKAQSIFQLEEITAEEVGIFGLTEQGLFNEAENEIFRAKAAQAPDADLIAYWFYDYLRQQPDETLRAGNFSFAEILQGLEDYFGTIPDIFLEEAKRRGSL